MSSDCLVEVDWGWDDCEDVDEREDDVAGAGERLTEEVD